MPIEKTHDKIILKHPKGPSVEILYYGATVISWKAADRNSSSLSERIFVSSKAALDGSKPVRGGIPVVFPCFGAPEHPDHLKLSQHGFARNQVWDVDSVVMDNEAGVSVRLTLHPNPAIAAVYDKSFALSYVVTLAEHQLSTDLHVGNPSSTDALEFQALLHTYVRAPANDVAIAPLQGKYYVDKTEASLEARSKLKEEKREAVDVRVFTDSVYEDAPSKIDVTW
ncbi:galactose mutarotase-like protein, partial [Auriscalpium vulgare]